MCAMVENKNAERPKPDSTRPVVVALCFNLEDIMGGNKETDVLLCQANFSQ